MTTAAEPSVQVWHEWPQPVQEAAISAAWDVHRRFEGQVEIDDLKQEALLWLATHPKEVAPRAHRPGWVRRKVRDRLGRKVVAELKGRPLPLDWDPSDG